jgi:hypothetical protein
VTDFKAEVQKAVPDQIKDNNSLISILHSLFQDVDFDTDRVVFALEKVRAAVLKGADREDPHAQEVEKLKKEKAQREQWYADDKSKFDAEREAFERKIQSLQSEINGFRAAAAHSKGTDDGNIDALLTRRGIPVNGLFDPLQFPRAHAVDNADVSSHQQKRRIGIRVQNPMIK